ncbi:AAA family ATPase [Pyxidicoccus sp. 3LFB2]
MSEEQSPTRTEVRLQDLLKSESLASTVWLAAVAHREHAPPIIRSAFNESAFQFLQRSRLPLGGVRDASRLSSSLLRRNANACIRGVQSGARLGFAATAVWAHANGGLHTSALSFATLKGRRVHPIEKQSAGESEHAPPPHWPAVWQAEELEQLATELASQASVPLEHAKLMLFAICLNEAVASHDPSQASPPKGPNVPGTAEPHPERIASDAAAGELLADASGGEGATKDLAFVTRHFTAADRQGTSLTASLSSLLSGTIERLQSLDDSSSEWADIKTFIDTCQATVEARDVRIAARTARLAQGLAALQKPMAHSALKRLKVTGNPELWRPEGCSPKAADACAENLELLAALLERVEVIFTQPTPATLEEMAARLENVKTLQEEVARLYGLITHAFQPGEQTAPNATAAAAQAFADKPANEDTPPLQLVISPHIQASEAAAPEQRENAPHKGGAQVSGLAPSVPPREISIAPVAQAAVANDVVPPSPAAEEPFDGPQVETVPSIALQPSLINLDVTSEYAQGPARELTPQLSQILSIKSEQVAPHQEKRSGQLTPIPRREAANLLLANPTEESHALFIHALIRDGDVAGAYWVARAEESRGRESAVPSWLLEALVGSLHLSGDGSLVAQGLFDLATAHTLPASEEGRMLALATALPAALREPSSGMVSWLEPIPDTPPHLQTLVDAVRSYAEEGYALPENVQVVLTNEPERAERLKAVAAEVERWQEQALLKRCGYSRATTVWMHLLRDSELKQLLDTAAEDDRDNLSLVDEHLRLWRDRTYVDAKLAHISSEKLGDARPIVGRAQKWLHAAVEEACARVTGWYDLARVNEKVREGDWLWSQLQTLRRSVAVSAPPILDWLDGPAVQRDSAATVAAAAALSRAIRMLASVLYCPEIPPPPSLPSDITLVERLLDGSRGLDSLLAYRLLLVPEVRLAHGREHWGAALSSIPPVLAQRVLSPLSLVQNIEAWVEKRDFRYLPPLLEAVEDEELHARLEERITVALEESRRALKTDLARARADIERAMVDGVLSETGRAEAAERLESLVDERTLDFAYAGERLQSVLAELAASRHLGVEKQRERWKALRSRLLSTLWTAEQREHANQRIEEVLAAEDYRSADELLSALTESIDKGTEFDAALFAPQVDALRHLESFIRVLPHFEREMASIKGRQAPGHAQVIVSNVLAHAETRREVKGQFDAWMAMAAARGNLHTALREMPALLERIGLRRVPDTGAPVAPERENADTRVVALRAAFTSASQSPVPHFGSRADSRLKVICVWEHERTDVLSSVINQLRSTDEGTLIVYFGRLGLARRRQLSLTCRREKTAAVVIDEWLFLYLATMPESGARLSAFFECALPFAAINPYSQRASASVPKEMFFGREEMANELASFDGTCLVYGGRQLGKSALLEHVARRFNEADERNVAIRIDIKDIGDPAADRAPEDLWPRLAEELKHLHVLPGTAKGDKPEEIVRRLTESLAGAQARRLLILLDEADNFLDADAKRNFDQVKHLRDLMTRSPGHCKVVLAGLHNVQRFQGIANQPLAHFGQAQLVGPLSPRDADALVRKPLAALGFRFAAEERNGSILRILSYTNYHPGLIQLFCRELVTLLQTRGDPQQNPPYVVREADVEEVYRRPETRKLIRDRFEWTVALDERYQAVAWSMVAHHVFNHEDGDHGGYAESMSTNDVLALARGFWEAGFRRVDQEEMRGLLDEMVGLGVLVRTAHGNYRLRSPNLVRLLGTGNEVLARLEELSKRPSPRAAFDADHHHVKLDSSIPPTFSPLTYAQERQLTQPQSSMVVVLGSAATQVELLPAALERIVRQQRPQTGAFGTIPPEALRKKALSVWLSEFTSAQPRGCERMLCLAELSPDQARDGALLAEAAAYCGAQRTTKRWLRVVFTLRPQAAWEVLSHAIENPFDGKHLVLALRRWTAPAIDRLLDEVDVRTADSDFRRRILEITTGGWPARITAFSRAVQGRDERRVAGELEATLKRGTPGSAAFWHKLELDGLPRVTEVLKLVHDGGGILPGTTFEGVLEGDLGPLQNRSDRLVWLLQQLGCLETLESSITRLQVERCVAEALP